MKSIQSLFLVILIYSCNESGTADTSEYKTDSVITIMDEPTKELEDIILAEYPKEIDSIITLELDSIIKTKNFSIDEVSVCHPVSLIKYNEGNDIEVLPGVDHNKYQVITYLVDPNLNSERWLIELDLEFNLLKKISSEHITEKFPGLAE